MVTFRQNSWSRSIRIGGSPSWNTQFGFEAHAWKDAGVWRRRNAAVEPLQAVTDVRRGEAQLGR